MLEQAKARATEHIARQTRVVTDEAVADRVIALADCGYIPDTQTADIVRAYLSGAGILLTGPAGVGKTFLMSLLAGNKHVQHAERDINDWGLSGIHGWYDWRDGREVVIDDLGTERTAHSYGDKEDLLKLVIEHRYAAQKVRTHFTTNLTAAQISARYGERILDRIMGMCTAFSMTGESYRRKKVIV